MSNDFIALFDSSTEACSLEWLLERLPADPVFGEGVIDRYWDHWTSKAWAVETSPAPVGPKLVGPGGFVICVKPGIIELYHMTPFFFFAGDSESRDALRRSCRRVADMVGSARAIYTHELMPYDGASLNEVERVLRTEIGPPAESFEDLREADYFGPRAWYIDTFADLGPPPV